MKIVIIGSGNIATVMGGRMAEAGHKILQIAARRKEPAAQLAAELGCGYTTRWEEVSREAALYVVALSDNALAGLGDVLQLPGKLVVHTAGAVSGAVLQSVSERFGVLYPLQSLRSQVRPFPEFPLLVDTNKREDLSLLLSFARTLSRQVQEADDTTRLKLHVAAVLVNNFTNYLYTLSEEFCRKEGLDFSLLFPILRETAERLQRYSPKDVQTGPAVRGDQGTIRRHLEVLNNYKDLTELYRLFTNQIEAFYRPQENSGG
ncbi:MAG: DUF2520 domain-containing protein [Bacteroidetes bacterium]|nr:DUF2520 domain-containing protein [Bacteroidota bacterium]